MSAKIDEVSKATVVFLVSETTQVFKLIVINISFMPIFRIFAE